MKKFLIFGITMLHVVTILGSEKKSKRVSDPHNKSRSHLSSSQPIPIVSTKILINKLSQSSPPDILLQYPCSPGNYPFSPEQYFGLGNLNDDFSPVDDHSTR